MYYMVCVYVCMYVCSLQGQPAGGGKKGVWDVNVDVDVNVNVGVNVRGIPHQIV